MRRAVYIIAIGLMMLNLGNSTIRAQKEAFDLETILEIINYHDDMSIKEWSVTARESMDGIETKEQFLKEADRLKDSFADYQWQISQNEQALALVGERQDSLFIETVTFTSSLKSNTDSYLTYEIKGTSANSVIMKQLQKKRTAVEKNFSSQYTIFFTCVKGEISGNIDGVLTSKLDSLLTGLHAVETESVKEKNFVSVTANSSLFKQSFISKQYNLQLAMRIDGMSQKTSFVIGTPIITFEY